MVILILWMPGLSDFLNIFMMANLIEKKSTMIKQAVSTSENIRKTVPVGSKGEPVMKTVALKKGNTESASDPMRYTVAAARKNTSNNSMKFVIIRSETFMTCSEDEISCIDNV